MEFGLEASYSMYESFTGKATLSMCQTLCDTFSITFTPETLMVSKRQHFKKLLENDSSFELIDAFFECIQNNYKLGLTLILTCSASMTNINRNFNRFIWIAISRYGR